MNYWDSIRELQRVVSAMDPLRDQIRRMEELRRQMLSNPVKDVVEDIRRREQMIRDAVAPPWLARDLAAEVMSAREALTMASVALPGFQLGFGDGRLPVDVNNALTTFLQVTDLVRRLNASIDSAAFIGELELDPAEDGDESNPIPTEQLETKLVTLASPETMAALRAVEFAPIAALDQALRQPETMLAMDARSFEAFVAALVDRLGFDDVVLTPKSRDHGRDVLATKRVHGLSILFAFECKRYSANHPVGVAVARALLGTIVHGHSRANKGVLVTTSTFTKGARSFILTEPALDGKDFDGLVGWLQELKTTGDTA